MESSRFVDEYGRRGPFYKEVNQYIHELMVQTAQTAACNISHPVEARLARWLLMTRDRTSRDTFAITHELLAGMLGVLRGAVTKAPGSLQRRKVISYRHGEIIILDGQRLEAVACRCYQIVKTLGRKSDKS